MTFIVVRARSDVKVERSIRETMGYMNLTRVNHAVIIPDNPQYRGMLQKAKDYITWGEADAGMVERMLAERGRMVGDAPLTDAIVAEHTDYKNISEFAKAITAGEAQVKDIPGLKRVFRLHPSWYEGLGRHQAQLRRWWSPRLPRRRHRRLGRPNDLR